MRLKFITGSRNGGVSHAESPSFAASANSEKKDTTDQQENGEPEVVSFSVPSVTPEFSSSVLAPLRSDRRIIQDFRPMSESIEWQLGQLSWDARGLQAFLNDGVPYRITNDGNLSRKAAEVVFEGLLAAEAAGLLEETVWMLEPGAGLGLFARYFLDDLKARCCEAGKDFYGRIRYVVADRSQRMLDELQRGDLFGEHRDRVVFKQANLLVPDFGLGDLRARADEPGPGFRAIFLNYVLDCLPSVVLRVQNEIWNQVCLRTSVPRGINLRDFISLEWDQILRLAGSTDPEDLRKLIELRRVFCLEVGYQPVDVDTLPYGNLAKTMDGEHECVLLNSKAIGCLENLLTQLLPGGCILINDYDDSPFDPKLRAYHHQRYGWSAALGLNAPLLDAHFRARTECSWVEPIGRNPHLCSRLLGRGVNGKTAERFQNVFSYAAYQWHFTPLEEARNLVEANRWESARAAFARAMERQPGNWALLLEIADFLTFKLADYDAALRLTEAALRLNPMSTGLWNTHGDCLYYLNRFDEAHGAFLRALELNPDDVRARFNLTFTFQKRRDLTSALRIIAEGLVLDRAGRYRERLLNQQAEILRDLTRIQETVKRCAHDRFLLPECL